MSLKSLEIFGISASSIEKEFKKYSVINTGKVDKLGYKIFWVLKKDDAGDYVGYVCQPKTTKPFDFAECVFSEDFIAVRSGFETEGIPKRKYLMISTKHWVQVVLAKVGGKEFYKCTGPTLNDKGEIDVESILP